MYHGIMFARGSTLAAAAESLRTQAATFQPSALLCLWLTDGVNAQPFAGIYRTVFLPNAADDLDARLEQLKWAVKQVYASTYSIEARAYANSQVKEPHTDPSSSQIA